MVIALANLLIGWLLFVFAAINLVRVAYDYSLQKEGSTGFCAILRALLFATELTGWYYIVFYRFPLLMITASLS